MAASSSILDPPATALPQLVAVGFPPITVSENSATSVVDLSKGFIDPGDPSGQLPYSITADSNPSLFASTSIDASNGQLSLAYSSGVSGTARLTIAATDPAGDSVSAVLMVMVTSIGDTAATGRTAESIGQSAAATRQVQNPN